MPLKLFEFNTFQPFNEFIFSKDVQSLNIELKSLEFDTSQFSNEFISVNFEHP